MPSTKKFKTKNHFSSSISKTTIQLKRMKDQSQLQKNETTEKGCLLPKHYLFIIDQLINTTAKAEQ